MLITIEENRAQLSSLIEATNQRMQKATGFDSVQEVQAYCEELECQVNLTVEGAISHLRRVQEDLIKEIDEYRSSLLDKTNAPGMSAHEFAELTNQTSWFARLWTAYLRENRNQLDESSIQEAKRQATKCIEELDYLSKRQRQLAFNNRFMRFKPVNLFRLENDCIGRLENCNLEEEEGLEVKEKELTVTLDSSNALLTLEDQIRSLMFLTNDQLVSASDQTGVNIWDCAKRQLCYQFSSDYTVTCMTQLANGILACGCSNGFIMLTDLTTLTFKRSLCEHFDSVIALREVRGRLVSYCSRGIIIVWDLAQFDVESPVLLKIDSEQVSAISSPLGVFSNGFFVTCSYESNCVLKVWNSNTGKLIIQKSSSLALVTNLLILRNDQVALASLNGSIKVLDMVELKVISKLDIPNAVFNSNTLAQLPNGYLVAVASVSTTPLYIVNPSNGQLIQQFELGHCGPVNSVTLTQNGRLLATASADKTFMIWKLWL